ncbi:fam-l protein [Plasmodium brasilianum]|uniref:Fam-l protein n=1 Tax=Plasmodium brasilianum TaxID=5824 RepID=A0ACB9YAL9_PLABR|nr:fam-l protein [Plasmodium brasilianum]
MEQKIKPLFFSKITVLIIFTWICYLNSDMRLLERCNRDNNSNIIGIKKDVTNKGILEKNYIFNYGKGDMEANKQSKGNLSMTSSDNKQATKNKTCIFENKKYSHIEKKIFKELDYVGFVKKNRTVSYKVYKKIIRKKLAIRFTLPPLLFLLLLILIIVDVSLVFAVKESLLFKLGLTKKYLEQMANNVILSPILKKLKMFKEFWKNNEIWGSDIVCRLFETNGTVITEARILG